MVWLFKKKKKKKKKTERRIPAPPKSEIVFPLQININC